MCKKRLLKSLKVSRKVKREACFQPKGSASSIKDGWRRIPAHRGSKTDKKPVYCLLFDIRVTYYLSIISNWHWTVSHDFIVIFYCHRSLIYSNNNNNQVDHKSQGWECPSFTDGLVNDIHAWVKLSRNIRLVVSGQDRPDHRHDLYDNLNVF